LREIGILSDSVCHGQEGCQKMVVKGNDGNDVHTVSLGLTKCMVHIRNRLPTTEEITPLMQYCLTQVDAPMHPSFSDEAANNFYQQVIDTENYNSNSMEKNKEIQGIFPKCVFL
jgi:hypothetical protein